MSNRRFTPSREQELFLVALATGYSVTGAAKMAGVDRRLPYHWRAASPVFAAEWQAAWAAGADAIEDEALRRAVSGVEKPIYRGGEVVGHVTEFSDTMLMHLLKARKPEKYGTGKNTGTDIDFEGAKDALIRKFTAATEPQRPRDLFEGLE